MDINENGRQFSKEMFKFVLLNKQLNFNTTQLKDNSYY